MCMETVSVSEDEEVARGRDVVRIVCPYLGVQGSKVMRFVCTKESGCGNVHGWCPIRDR